MLELTSFIHFWWKKIKIYCYKPEIRFLSFTENEMCRIL